MVEIHCDGDIIWYNLYECIFAILYMGDYMDKIHFMNLYNKFGKDNAVIVITKEHDYRGKITRIIDEDECFLVEEKRPYGAAYAIRWKDVERIEVDENDIPKEYIEGLQI